MARDSMTSKRPEVEKSCRVGLPTDLGIDSRLASGIVNGSYARKLSKYHEFSQDDQPRCAMNGAMSPQEVAERLGVSRDTVLRWLRSGKLAAVKLGWRTWRITEDNLAAFTGGEVRKAELPKPATPIPKAKKKATKKKR